ncbi:hypothetical protein [Arenibacter latericius]|uniref:hypothetical protein n=1 Tax=Arenibacter latericius TaxID=86104 RepID=UPI0003FF043F|nr:hypothetical protein [Arenibacter latericius]MDX1363768.1 hypothetical protein [Arenibacter latericius]
MKKILVSFLLLSCYLGMSQAELNNYKYIIVPVKFEAFKEENQHQTSTLIKYILTQNGFNAVYDNALPEDLLSNRCLGLLLALHDDSSMFTTKLNLSLKDCQSQEIFVTQEGRSKEKDFKEAYSGAIKESLQSLSGEGYRYEPSSSTAPLIVSYKDDVKRIPQTATQDTKKNTPTPIVQQKATPENQSFKDMSPVPSDYVQEDVSFASDAKEVMDVVESDVLYAQAITNGYQLVDSTPKIVMTLQQTSFSNFYFAKPNWQEESGILFKKGGNWIFEYYDGNELVNKKMNIKF